MLGALLESPVIRAATLRASLQSLFGADVVTVSGDPREPSEALAPEEEVLVARAVAKRRAEFAKGRECARRALAEFGIQGYALLSGQHREPLWPPGLVGTLTHCDGFCAVAVARREHYAALGLDAEPDESIEPRLQSRICTPEELDRLGDESDEERGRLARLVFSAKEAFYKCQHTVSREFLGFQDAMVTFEGDELTVTLLRPAKPFRALTEFHGRWCRTDGLLMTAVTLPAVALRAE